MRCERRGASDGLGPHVREAHDGSVYCWGSNENGQLGNRTTIHGGTPLPVYGLP